jgi:hypothetical protein
MKTQLSNQDYEAFSAYLDDQLSPAEKTRLEAKLAANSDLRATLDELAATRALLRRAKTYRAPRNFTLTPEVAQKYRRKSFFAGLAAFRFSMAVSALSILLVLGLEIGNLLPMAASSQMALAPAAAPMAAAEKAMSTQALAPQATMEIQWAPGSTTSGQGGGPSNNSGGFGSDQNLGMGGGGGPPIQGPLTGPVQLPAQSVQGLIDNSAPPAPAQADAQRAVAAGQSNNPILGIPSTGDGGKIITSNGDLAEIPEQPAAQRQVAAELQSDQASGPSPRQTVELALLACALLAGLAAFLIRRAARR